MGETLRQTMTIEQAPALDTSIDDLASFLDTPEPAPKEETEEPTTDEATADSDTAADEPDEQADEPEESGDDEPTPVEKITIKVKGEDGAEESLELTTDEIASGYMRQKAFTQKTQALAEREGQAVEFLKSKHDEIRNQYLSQAEFARAAVAQMAGLRTEAQMAELASSDPAAWVAEQQRQKGISNFLNQLDQQISGSRQQAAQQQQQAMQQALKRQFDTSWAELAKAKIDKPALEKIYGAVNKTYGFSNEELGNVYDHRLVNMMRDATAYQALKAQKATVTKQVEAAPRMPSRQTNPAQERRDAARENRFKSGRAKLSDLAAYINS